MLKGTKIITPDGYVGYYRNHSKNFVWLSQKMGKKMYPYPISSPEELESWPTTNEECNIKEKYERS